MEKGGTWSKALYSLKQALEDETLAHEWTERVLTNSDKNTREYQYITKLPPKDAAQRILHCLGRGHALIEQSKKWTYPVIGKSKGASTLNITRGVLWKYVMTYCGWEQCTKQLGITQRLQSQFLEPNGRLVPPNLGSMKIAQVSAWTSDLKEVESNDAIDESDSQGMGDFLSLGNTYREFPEWLKGETVELTDAAILAILRNIVAHGCLSPSKAVQWDIDELYVSATRIVIRSFSTLIAVLSQPRL